MEFDEELDTRGLFCPIPIVKTKAAMDRLQPGGILKLLATDPGSTSDVPAFAKHTRNTLLDSQVDGADYVYYLRKSVEAGPTGATRHHRS